MMDVRPSGYYAWRREFIGEKRRDHQRLLGLLKQAWLESGCVYGYRNSHSICATWASNAASTGSPDCCAGKV